MNREFHLTFPARVDIPPLARAVAVFLGSFHHKALGRPLGQFAGCERLWKRALSDRNHAQLIRKFARVLRHLATEEEKQLVFTTHSEQFLLSLLACVKERLLKPEQLACYHVAREKRQTIFTREPVSAEGQISGGLSSFMEGELQDIRTFLSVSE
jgi:hypothetical protein